MTNTKKIVLAVALAVIMACGFWSAMLMGQSDPTYDGSKVDVMALYEDNTAYDNSKADGAAAIIVNENLEKTASDNVVFSVVFNFRGYDTLGESFILIAGVAGCLVILRKSKEHGKEGDHE